MEFWADPLELFLSIRLCSPLHQPLHQPLRQPLANGGTINDNC